MTNPPPNVSPFDPELLKLSEAAQLILPGEKPLSDVTLWRWAVHGKRGVMLPAVHIGRAMFTTRGAIEWFFQELQSKQAHSTTTAPE